MRIGEYEILFELARGGMGAVYLARAVGPRGIERLVAIKRAHEQVPNAQRHADRFLDEAQITAFVHHANVVSMHHVGSDEDGYFLVFDYVEGESLDGLICRALQRKEHPPLPIVLRIIADALAGLQATHEATDNSGKPLGILHRDVSLQNLLVGRDGVTRLADFGIAKSALSSVVTEEGYIQGKLAFLAPEYLQRRPVNRTVDIYSMGVTLWTALAGRTPWTGAAPARVIQTVLSEGVPWLSSVAAHVPTEISEIVARACARDSDARFETARQMLDAVEGVGRKLGLGCGHLDVAEYVERMVGDDLAARRAAVAHCGNEGISAAPKSAPRSGSARAREAEAASSTPEPATRSAGEAEAYVATDAIRARWEGPSPWRRMMWPAAFLSIVGIAAAFFAAREPAPGQPAPSPATSPAAPPAAKASVVQSSRARLPSALSPPRAEGPESRGRSEGARIREAAKRPRSSALRKPPERALPVVRETPLPAASNSPDEFEAFSTENPYR